MLICSWVSFYKADGWRRHAPFSMSASGWKRMYRTVARQVSIKPGCRHHKTMFAPPSEGFANRINSKIILIDGERLASLMVDNDVGVAAVGVYKLKRIDSDYFEGEQLRISAST